MTDPTLPELAARVARIETMLGLDPPTPPPALAPATPTGLRLTTLSDGRLQLDWDDVMDATSWDVLDILDLVTPVKETVTVPRSIRSALKAGTRRRYAIRAHNAAGASPLSVTVDVPATTTPTPEPAGTVPGQLLNLSRWYLTLPIADPTGRDTSGPWDVYQPELATFTYPQYFHTGGDSHGPYVEYVAPAKGVTTSGSGATRCELREMVGPTVKAAWSFADGKPHSLTCTLTVDGTSIDGRKEIIVGQIHSVGGSPPLILAVNHTRSALEVYRQGPRQGDLLTSLQPGELFTYCINASGGRLKLYAARGTIAQLPSSPTFDWPASVLTEQSGEYFKAGAYNKELASSGAAGQSIVRHYRLDLV